jgi:hypothetical protein
MTSIRGWETITAGEGRRLDCQFNSSCRANPFARSAAAAILRSQQKRADALLSGIDVGGGQAKRAEDS